MKLLRLLYTSAGDIRRAGSAALDLAYVAAGRLDGYWESGLKAWDLAAGALIVREAGGLVTDYAGDGKWSRPTRGSPRKCCVSFNRD